MKTRVLLITSLIGGLLSLALSNVPFVNLVNLLLCAGFWVGPLLAVWLYRRQVGTVQLGQGARIGTLAGVWHGAFGFLLSLMGLAGGPALLKSIAQLAPGQTAIDQTLVDAGALGITLVGVVVSILFGTVGGLIGGAIFKTRTSAEPAVA